MPMPTTGEIRYYPTEGGFFGLLGFPLSACISWINAGLKGEFRDTNTAFVRHQPSLDKTERKIQLVSRKLNFFASPTRIVPLGFGTPVAVPPAVLGRSQERPSVLAWERGCPETWFSRHTRLDFIVLSANDGTERP